jgi:hypothetical protein
MPATRASSRRESRSKTSSVRSHAKAPLKAQKARPKPTEIKKEIPTPAKKFFSVKQEAKDTNLQTSPVTIYSPKYCTSCGRLITTSWKITVNSGSKCLADQS